MRASSTSKDSTRRHDKRRSNVASELRNAMREEQRQMSDSGDLCVLCAASGLSRPAFGRVEAHHIGGQHHDPHAKVPLCEEHHRAVTEAIRTAGADMRPQSGFLRTLVQMLLALGTLFVMAGRALLAWAERLSADILRQPAPQHA